MSEPYDSAARKPTFVRPRGTRAAWAALALFAASCLVTLPAAAQAPASEPMLSFTASTDNVQGSNESIRIDVFRWSTDAERDQLLAAWNPASPAPTGRGVKREPTPDELAPDPAAEDNGAPRAGPAGRGRGGRGDGAGPRRTPEASLATALHQAPTVGYLWSPEVTGYAVHSAVRVPLADGGERIILITDRRLGAWNDLWTPVRSAIATDYGFSVIELHLNAKGEGEGKVSLTGKVAADSAAKVIDLESYAASPVILKNVRRRAR